MRKIKNICFKAENIGGFETRKYVNNQPIFENDRKLLISWG